MGYIDTITYDKFPKQKDENYIYPVGDIVKVCYHYDTSKYHYGTIVRNDLEEPFETIIKLDNGRYLRATECQFTHVDEEISDDMCEWKQTDTKKLIPYKTSCGNEDLYDNSYKYCPYCGKKIKVVGD